MSAAREGRGDTRLRRAARVEGLAAGSFRLAPAIVTLTVTLVALDLGTSVGVVQRAVAAATLTAALAIALDLWRLRRGPRSPIGRATVLCSFGVMAAALLVVALARDAWMLTAGLAGMGWPIAVNARFRHAAMRPFAGREGTFQGRAHRWNRVARIGGVLLLGGIVAAGPLGWRWAAAAAALWFAVLGAMAFRLGGTIADDHARRPHAERRLSRQWRLPSVKRHVGTMFLASGVMQLALAALEPALRASGAGEHAGTVAAVTLGGAQLAMSGSVGRIAGTSDRSARRSALHASLVLPFAAPLAWLVGGVPGAIAAVAVAFAWMAVVEVGFGAAAAATRVGLGRVGQLASLLGALAGYAGSSVGSLAASSRAVGSGTGLALALLAGALLAVGLAAWTPRHAAQEQVATRGDRVRLSLAPLHPRALRVRVADRKPGFVLYAGDLLQARTRFDGRALSEPVELVRVEIWTGTPGWTWRLLARLRGRVGHAGGPWPLDVVPFAAGSFGGTLRWVGPGRAAVRVMDADGRLSIDVGLPPDERGRKVRWRTLGGVAQDDPPPPAAGASTTREENES